MHRLNEVCPLLVPQDSRRKRFCGFISVGGVEFRIRIELSPEDTNSLKNTRIDCEWRLAHLLRGSQEIIQKKLELCSNLASFLQEFKSLIEPLVSSRREFQKTTDMSFHAHLAGEINKIGWDRVKSVDASFSSIQLKAWDSRQRLHVLTVKIPKQYPAVALSCLADLPLAFEPHIPEDKDSYLSNLYSEFEYSLAQYEDFWDLFDELDEKTWIIEPEHRNRSSTMRRIAIGTNSSVQIDVDPINPRGIPECRFLGPDHVVSQVRQRMGETLELWNAQLSLFTNLQTLMGIDFPSPQVTNKEDFSMDCGICYAYRLDGKTPDKVCDNSRCGRFYHQACLYEWLRGLATCRQSFGTLFGECPYCEQPITIKMLG
ncbi:E3 ubiquitin-protein ligase FANCL-like [Oscarella lobularis]|uniref:E3 ubiquitin-protein ligase FANCL-like n=1 Tax=Oscarella lobularis TaxID=121494 RepID=UPI003313CAF0